MTYLEVVSAMVPFSEFLTMQGGGTAIVAVFVNAIRVLNARRSTKHWFIGWIVFATSVGGYATAGTVSYILDPMNPYFFVNGLSGFMFGLIAGNIIGAWIWWFYHKEIEREDDEK